MTTPFLPPAVVDLALWVGEYYASGPGDALARGDAAAGAPGTRVDVPDDEDGRARRGDAGRAAGARRSVVKGAKQRRGDRVPAHASPASRCQELVKQGVSTATVRSARETRRRAAARRDRARAIRSTDETGAGGAWTMTSASDGRADADAGAGAGAGHARGDGATPARSARRCCTASRAAARPSSTCASRSESWSARPARADARARDRAHAVGGGAVSRARFGTRVAIQHSGLSDGERHDQWHRIRRGDVDVVVGTRSAVFAPLERLGLDHRRRGARRRRTSRTKRRGTTAATSPSCAAAWTARSSCSAAPRRRSNRRPTPRPAATICVTLDAPRAGSAARRASRSWTCGASTPRSAPTSRSAGALLEAIERSAHEARAVARAAQPARLRDA